MLDYGIKINVSPFIESGEKIVGDARTLEYVKSKLDEVKFPQINLITKAYKAQVFNKRFWGAENLQVSTKGPGDFITSADKRTEKILIDELQKAHPEYGIVTEETGIINKKILIIDE